MIAFTPIAFLEPEEVLAKRVTITFTAPPTDIIIKRANLRYDKKFAFCFNEDDGADSAYRTTFAVFSGRRTIQYTDDSGAWTNCDAPASGGLYFTDGCGNKVNFTGENNLNMKNVQETTRTSNQVSKKDLREMAQAGHVFGNHSWSNKIRGDGLPLIADGEPDLDATHAYLWYESGIDGDMSGVNIDGNPWSKYYETGLTTDIPSGSSLGGVTGNSTPGWYTDVVSDVQLNDSAIRSTTGLIPRQFSAPSADNVYRPYMFTLADSGRYRIVISRTRNLSYKIATANSLEEWWTQSGNPRTLAWRRDYNTWNNGPAGVSGSTFPMNSTSPTASLVSWTNPPTDGNDWDFIKEQTDQYSGSADHTAVIGLGTHRTNLGPTVVTSDATSYRYNQLRYAMSGLAYRYAIYDNPSNIGVTTRDTMWFAPMMKVQEYLDCKDNTIINQTVSGSQLILDFNFKDCYFDSLEHSLTLLVSASQNITNVEFENFDYGAYTTGSSNVYVGNKDNISYKGMINVGYRPAWSDAVQNRLKAEVAVEDFESDPSQVKKDLAEAALILLPDSGPSSLRAQLQTRIDNVSVVDGFKVRFNFGWDNASYRDSTYNNLGDNTVTSLYSSGSTFPPTNSCPFFNSADAFVDWEIGIIQPFIDAETNSTSNTNDIANQAQYPYTVMRSSWKTPAATNALIEITGLDVTKYYDFELSGTRGFTDNDNHYIVRGNTSGSADGVMYGHLVKSNGINDSGYEYVVVPNIQPNYLGKVTIEIGGGRFAPTAVPDGITPSGSLGGVCTTQSFNTSDEAFLSVMIVTEKNSAT